MAGVATTFAGNIITQTSSGPLSGEDAQITTLVTSATNVEAIDTPNFLSAEDTNFYQSPVYNQVITQKNPPDTSSYAKDPSGAQDDSYDPDMTFTNYTKLAPGLEQILVTGNRSIFVADKSQFVIVDGNSQVGYDGHTAELIYGKVNQKFYNGSRVIFNGTSTRFYDQLLTTFEHQPVQVTSLRDDTAIHFGPRTITRKGNETDVIYGQTNETNFGNIDNTVYGKSFETIKERRANQEGVVSIVSVAGLQIEMSAGFTAETQVATAVDLMGYSFLAILSESMLGLVHGKIMGIGLKKGVTRLNAYGFHGKVIGGCLRAVAFVFGIFARIL